MNDDVKKIFNELLGNYPALEPESQSIVDSFDILVRCFRDKGKLMVCGNGGSAADSGHIVSELMKSFRLKRDISESDKRAIMSEDGESGSQICGSLEGALPAICLSSQTSFVSAYSNDRNYDYVFAQQVYGYRQKGDVLLAISTSGNSVNVCNAAVTAKAFEIPVIVLTGKKQSRLSRISDVTIHAPVDDTYRVQEYHQPVYHCLCAMLEEHFFGNS